MKRYISSSAYSRNRVERAITHDSEHLNDHLAKLVLFPDSEYVDHWMGEIHAFLPRVPKLKSSNKFPNSEYIYELLSEEDDNIEAIRETVLDLEYELTPVDADNDTILEVMDNYHHWVADRLSSIGRVTRSEVYEFLKSLMGDTSNKLEQTKDVLNPTYSSSRPQGI